MPPRRTLVAAVAAASLVAACSSGDDDATADPADATGSSTAATDGGEATATGTAGAPGEDPAATTTGGDGTVAAGAGERPAGDERDFGEIDELVAELADERDLDGAGLVVVDREDGIVHEVYVGDVDADRVSLIASSSKMISAGVLANLADRGLLDLDAPVADVAPWGSGNPDVTPAQLVSGSSGLVGLLDDPLFAPYLCQFIASGTLQACASQVFTTEADDDRVVAPDTEFRYGGAAWTVAGAVAEVASGRTWAELIDEIYVGPCEVPSLGYGNHFAQLGPTFTYPAAFDGDPSILPPTDTPNIEGGAWITPPDYARLLLLHLREGRCGDEQVLSPEAVERMHADRVNAVYGGGELPGYGFGWWVDDERITDPGAYGSVPWLDLEDGYGAYLVIEADSTTGASFAAALHDPVDAVMAGT